jgi:predicted DNA-binding protein (MmcQ/YjbR family)
MNLDSLRKYCLSFPQAAENLQWGEELCFKVAGKIFTVVSLGSVPQGLCFKCSPEKFAELCEQGGIRPAPYVGRYKWVLLEQLDILSDSELRELIRESYEMVGSKTKAKAKPKLRRKTKKGSSKSLRSSRNSPKIRS